MRHTPVLTLGIVVALALFAASTTVAQQTVVEFWFGENVEGYIAAMQNIVQQFNASQEDIYVDMSLHGTIQGDKLDQLKVAIAGGVPPDVAYLDGTAILELGLGSNMFLPLNDVTGEDTINAFNFLPVPTAEFQYEGTWYGVPFRTDSRGLYVNEDHFMQVGLDARTDFDSLEDLDSAAAKLTLRNDDGNIQRLGFAPYGNNFGGDIAWIWLFGGEMYDWDNHRPKLAGNPNNIVALEWILSYADLYGPTASASQANFLAQTTAMHVNSTTRLTQYAELAPELNYWVQQIPAPTGGVKTTLSTVLGVAIPYGAANAAAAMEFVEYLSRPETQVYWYEHTRSLPANFEAFTEIIRTIDDPRELAMVTMLPGARGYPPLYAYYTRPILQTQLNLLRRREVTPAQALENTERTAWARYVEVFGGE